VPESHFGKVNALLRLRDIANDDGESETRRATAAAKLERRSKSYKTSVERHARAAARRGIREEPQTIEEVGLIVAELRRFGDILAGILELMRSAVRANFPLGFECN
jgi:hypothetical protein